MTNNNEATSFVDKTESSIEVKIDRLDDVVIKNKLLPPTIMKIDE